MELQDFENNLDSIKEMLNDASISPSLRISILNSCQMMFSFLSVLEQSNQQLLKQLAQSNLKNEQLLKQVSTLESKLDSMLAVLANKNTTIKQQNSERFQGKKSEKNPEHDSTDPTPDEPRNAKGTKRTARSVPPNVEVQNEKQFFDHNGSSITEEEANAMIGRIVYNKNGQAFRIAGFFQTGTKIETIVTIKTITGYKPTLNPVDPNCHEEWKVQVPSFDFLKKTQMSASLFAYISYLRFSNKMPLNRISEHLQNMGLHFSRQSLAEYYITTTYLLEPLLRHLTRRIVASPWIGVDETFFKSHDKGKEGNTYRTYLVGMTSDIGAVFIYSGSRDTYNSQKILIDNNIDKNTFVITDGLYKTDWNTRLIEDSSEVASQKKSEDIFKHGLCWVHAKRYFCNVVNYLGNKDRTFCQATVNWAADYEAAKDITNRISEIFKADKEALAKAQNAQQLVEYRQHYVKPLVDALYDRYEATYQDIEAIKKTNKKSRKNQAQGTQGNPKLETQKHKYCHKYKEAITYLFNNRTNLSTFLTSANGIMHNNKIEGLFNDFSVLRKAMMATSTMRGGDALAAVYSLHQTCKMYDIGVNEYLSKIYLKMTELSAQIKIDVNDQKRYLSDEIPSEELEKLMPWNFVCEK